MDKNSPKIRSFYNPDDKEKEIIRFVYQRKFDMESSPDRQDAMKDADKWDKQYEGRMGWKEKDLQKEEWQSKHTVPLTLSIIETALSEITDQTMRPLTLPRGTEDEAKARIMQRIFDYAWEVSDSDSLVYDALKDALTQGTAITQEYYLKDMKKITTSDSKGKETDHEVAEYEDIMGEIVKLQDFFVDENARGFRGPYAARDCIRRYIMNVDDVKQYFSSKTWDQFDNLKYVKAGGDTNYYEFYKPPQGINQDKQAEVLMYWARVPKDRLIVVVNDVLITNGPNPYKHKQLPFVRWLDIKRPHRFYGKGESELLESIQDETDTMRRMLIDRAHLDIDKMFLVSDRLAFSDEDLMARPHGMISVGDINAAKPIEYGDVPRSVELQLQHLSDDSIISTGINPRAQSLPQAGTATEAAMLKEATLKRLRLKVWLMKRESLIPLARMRVSNILQFYSQPKMEKIVGDTVSKEYQAEIERLRSTGQLVEDGDNKYRSEYRTIPLEGEEMDFDVKTGEPMLKSKPGRSFFVAKPEYFMPLVRGGYDIKFDASSNLQISKELMMSKDLEYFDRMFQLMQAVPGAYDPVKLGDMITRSYQKDPNALKTDQAVQDDQSQRLEQQITLAGMENKMMMQGQAVPSTANSSPAHTRVHLEFMNSDEFQKGFPAKDPRTQIFIDHVTGEIMAQTGRAQGSGGQAPEGAVPEGIQSNMANGITNRPGGVAQPQNRASEILPMNRGAGV